MGAGRRAIPMAGTVQAVEAAPRVGSGSRASGVQQGLGVGTMETPLDLGLGQEGGAGPPQAGASDPARAGLTDSQPPKCQNGGADRQGDKASSER